MNGKLAFYIAKRYFFSKKSTNVINLISLIALTGIALGTTALIVVLSVFNGFEKMAKSLLNAFNPDLKVVSVEGKYFSVDTVSTKLGSLSKKYDIIWSEALQTNALFEYSDRQYIGIVKGVDENFKEVTGIDTMILYGSFVLKYENSPTAVVGYGVASYLNLPLNVVGSMVIWLPKAKSQITINVANVFKRVFVYPVGIFSVHQQFDDKYVFVDIDFLRQALDLDENIVDAIEIKVLDKGLVSKVEEEVEKSLGSQFLVKNRYEQEEMFYKIVKSERLATILILTFIIIIASFNILGTMSMLIIDKKEDIEVLSFLGADRWLIKSILKFEGLIITLIGLILGLLFGLLLVYIQEKYGVIMFPAESSLSYEPYPVVLKFWNVVLTILIVGVIGYLSALIPVNYFIKKYLPDG